MRYTNDMQLLQYIYQNAKIGSSSLKIINSNYKNNDTNINFIIEEQIKKYDNLYKKASKELNKCGEEAKNTIQIPIIVTYTGIKIEIDENTNNNTISDALLKISILGIIDIQKVLKQHTKASKDILLLGTELLKIEEDFSKNLKDFF